MSSGHYFLNLRWRGVWKGLTKGVSRPPPPPYIVEGLCEAGVYDVLGFTHAVFVVEGDDDREPRAGKDVPGVAMLGWNDGIGFREQA